MQNESATEVVTDRQWLLAMAEAAIPERFSGSVVEYFDGTLRLPHSTRYPVYMAEESPWLIEPLNAMGDPNVSRVDIRGPAGSAKSLVGEIHIAWAVASEPGMYYYVHQSDPDGADVMEDRIMPMLIDNDFLAKRLPNDRHKQRIAKVAFPHMSLYCVGANLSAAQSKRVKYLTLEEPHLYKPGMMSAFEKRCEGVRNAKILTLSTGSVMDDESDKAFRAGTCEEWSVPCPKCGGHQIMTDEKDRLIFDRNEHTIDSNGQFIWSAILPTVRYNCAICGKDWPTSELARRDQSQRGRYEVTNPNSSKAHRSFHMEAVAVHYFDWGKILYEKMQASYAAKAGSTALLKDYIQKRRAMAWDEAPDTSEHEKDLQRITGDYLKHATPDDEIERFLCIDNQAGKASRGEGAHRWYVCRAYGQSESRLIDEGRITTWEELEELRIQLGVKPNRCFVDIAFDTQSVQAVCVRYGWIGLWGDNTSKEYFPHHETIMGQRVTRKYPFSGPNVGHVGLGTSRERRQAVYYFWCQAPVKTLWHSLRGGMAGYRYTHAADVSDAYKAQTTVEYKRQEIDKSGQKRWKWSVAKSRDNHLTDCEQMTLVAALLSAQIRPYLLGVGDMPVVASEAEKEAD